MESSRRGASSLKPSMSGWNISEGMNDNSWHLLPGLGVKWPSSWYVEGTSTRLALSAPDGWTNARRFFTQDTVANMVHLAVFREIVDSMIKARSKEQVDFLPFSIPCRLVRKRSMFTPVSHSCCGTQILHRIASSSRLVKKNLLAVMD